jgi:hypothetical protein
MGQAEKPGFLLKGKIKKGEKGCGELSKTRDTL